LISERTIINFLLWMGGLILGSYLALTAVEQNYWPLLLTGAAVIPILTLVVRDRLCAFPYLGSYVGGKFTFIPFGLAAADVGSIALILYFAINYVALRRKPISTGLLCFFLPILIIFLIVLYHDHSFGLKALGSSLEGSRPGILILEACVAFLCGINISTPSVSFFRKLPWWCFILASVSAIPYVISTNFPSLTPYLYNISDNLDVDSYVSANSFSQHSDAIGRSGPQAAIGGTLMMCLLCYYPITTWWRPGRWLLAFLGLACFALVLSSGYRNTLVTFVLTVVLCIWCYLSWRTLVLLPIFIIALFALSFNQDYHLIDLPLVAQRSLSVIPGDWNWDESVVNSADSSNDFRENIQKVYIQEYLYKSPWIGNGLSFNASKYAELNSLAEHDTPDHYYQAEVFITAKNFHTGWLSVYDIVGLIGSAAFVFLNLSMIWVSGRLVFGRGADRQSSLFPLKAWMFVYSVTGFFGFFTLFGDFKTAFPGLCFSAIVLYHLDKLDRATRLKPSLPVARQSFQLSGPKAAILEATKEA